MEQNNKATNLDKYIKYEDMNPDELWNNFMDEHDDALQDYFASLLLSSTESSSLRPVFKQLQVSLPEYIEKVRQTETNEEISRLEAILNLIPQILFELEKDDSKSEDENTVLVTLFSRMTELGDLPQEILANLDLQNAEPNCIQQ